MQIVHDSLLCRQKAGRPRVLLLAVVSLCSAASWKSQPGRLDLFPILAPFWINKSGHALSLSMFFGQTLLVRASGTPLAKSRRQELQGFVLESLGESAGAVKGNSAHAVEVLRVCVSSFRETIVPMQRRYCAREPLARCPHCLRVRASLGAAPVPLERPSQASPGRPHGAARNTGRNDLHREHHAHSRESASVALASLRTHRPTNVQFAALVRRLPAFVASQNRCRTEGAHIHIESTIS